MLTFGGGEKKGYLLPNDEKEQEHMNIISHLFRLILGGRLFLAPLPQDIKRILDIGTGTGDWAIDMGESGCVMFMGVYTWLTFAS